MKYGDTIKGECKYCDCVNFTFLGEAKESYMVGSIPEKHWKAICQECRIVQWIEVD